MSSLNICLVNNIYDRKNIISKMRSHMKKQSENNSKLLQNFSDNFIITFIEILLLCLVKK